MSEPHDEHSEETETCPPDDEKPTTSECKDEEDESQMDEKRTASERQDESQGDEKPTLSEGLGEKDESQVDEKPGASPKEEEPTAKPVAKQPQKTLRCFDPTGTVDIIRGTSGVAADEPMTVSQFFKKTIDKIPDKEAVSWKSNKEGPWQHLTYAEYKRLIYNVAKSFLKVKQQFI